MRVCCHPILGESTKRKEITIEVDGREIPAFEGEPIAAALLAAGIRIFRVTPEKHRPRGVYCAIGRCTDCAMTVDGQPNVRTCTTPTRDGMRIQTQEGLGTWPKTT